MKNLELYKTIEELVYAKTEKEPTEKPSFAMNYCVQQIKKRKLQSFTHTSKMNKIMKNFHQLDTYVNVEDLLKFIQKKNQSMKKEDNSESFMSWKCKGQSNLKSQEKTMKRVKQYLGNFYEERYNKENQNSLQLLQFLEKCSAISNEKRKNNHPFVECNIYDSCKEKPSKQNEKWNYYESKNHFMEDDHKEKYKNLHLQHSFKRQSLKNKKQRSQLIHQISTYLQIILENFHKKKWAKKKKKSDFLIKKGSTTNLRSRTSEKGQVKEECLRIKFNDNGRITSYETKFPQKSLQTELKSIDLTKTDSVTSQHSGFCTPKEANKQINRVKDNFTFRNRNIKFGVLKKIDSFLQVVETEEKMIKKDKNNCLNELNTLQNKIKIHYPKCFKSQITDENQLKILQRIVLQQK